MPGRLHLSLDRRSVVCPRCRPTFSARVEQQVRQNPSLRRSSTASPTTTLQQQHAYTHLSNRALIRLQGADVVDFLNGLLPARLQQAQKDHATPIFTAFLSAKGRILYDAFIYPPSNSETDGPWYVEVDGTIASEVFSHLKKHKLRRKFRLEKVTNDELGVYYSWPSQENITTEEPVIGGQDPRPWMGSRFLSSTAGSSQMLRALQDAGVALSLEDYTIHRMINGHAEGPRELVSQSALPQESNLDFDGGIDFHKGCYLGQELTIRTHHTGIVRKRILPCQISVGPPQIASSQSLPVFDTSLAVSLPPPESNISKMHAKGRAGRSTGKWLGGVGNIGLALCRLETMADIQLTAEGSAFDYDSEFAIVWEDGEADSDGKSTLREVRVRPFVPQWLRDGIEAGIKARTDRSKRRKQEEDDEDDEVD